MSPAPEVISSLSPETLEACLRAAVAAPSIHNTQPWLFRPHGPEIEVLADPARRRAVIDPAGRQRPCTGSRPPR